MPLKKTSWKYQGFFKLSLNSLNFIFNFQVLANKEVILSGGAINSPQLLMLSGVGNAADLKKIGIPVVCHLPGKYIVFIFHLPKSLVESPLKSLH